MKQIKCPVCDEKFTKLEGLHDHIDEDHSDLIPEGFTPQQYVYYTKTGKTHGNCVICKNETEWNETTGKYKRFCDNPKCKEEYREIFKKRMVGKYGKTTLLNDPEQQKKMLANRHISGEYEWTDGSIKTYTGSYELDFLKFLDVFMNMDSDDVITPSPHTYYYKYEGETKFYIPDVYIPSLNLEIEIKDGGSNPNMHHKIVEVDKVKERLKDDVMKSQKEIDYIKIVDKKYDDFFDYLMKKKDELAGAKNVKISSLMTEAFSNIIMENVSFDNIVKTDRKYEDGDGVTVVFYDNGKEVGTASTVEYDGKPNAFLHGFEVKPSLRNKGYGTAILKYMIKEYDVYILYVYKHNKSIHLYERFGFKKTGMFNKDMIIMQRKYNSITEGAIVTEGITIDKELYYNFDKLDSGKSNVILVTGLSGSGKSTLAKSLASKYNAEYVELDMFDPHSGVTNKSLESIENNKNAHRFIYDFLKTHPSIHNKFMSTDITDTEIAYANDDFLKYCISMAKKDVNKKYVIEGIQIYEYMSYYDKTFDCPMVIKMTPALQSYIRVTKRENWKLIDIIRNAPAQIKRRNKAMKQIHKINKKMITEGAIDYKAAAKSAEITISDEINNILYAAATGGHNIYIATDWHLWKYDDETYSIIRNERTKDIINTYNNIVNDDDDVFIYLGDLCDDEFQDKESLQSLLLELRPNTKILCKGNNDIFSDEFYKSCGFTHVTYKFMWEDILFSHFPLDHDYKANIHGHIHGCMAYKCKYNSHIDVYTTNGRPLPILDVLKSLPAYGKRITEVLEESYDNIEIEFIEEDNNMIDEAWSDIKNGVNPKSRKRLFHVSKNPDLDGKVLTPRVPEYLVSTGFGKDDPYYEEMKTPRVCFSPSINGCLNAIIAGQSHYIIGNDELYVYVPEKPVSEYKIKTNKNIIKDKDVFDAHTTGEVWVLEPVKLRLYGTIRIDQVSRHHSKYTLNKGAKLAKRTYKWHWQVKPNVIKGMTKDDPDYYTNKESYEPVLEVSNIAKDNDNYYDFERFVNGDSNILLITGLEASNTTKVAREYSQIYDATYINFDLFTKSTINQILDGTYEGTANAWYINHIRSFAESRLVIDPDNRDHVLKPTDNDVIKFVKYIFKNLNDRTKYVIEGICFYRYKELSYITMEYPLIVKHDSLKSTIKNFKLSDKLNLFNIAYDEISSSKDIKDWFNTERNKLNNFSQRTLDYRSKVENMHYKKDKYPVYVVLMHSGSALASAIKKVTGDEFSHASISFDPSLRNMYSFGQKYDSDILELGMIREDVHSAFLHRPIDFALYVTFVTADEFKAMKAKFYEIVKREKELRYSFAGLIKYAIGVDAETKNKMFCSEFVANVLNSKYNNTDGYYASQVKPEDFKNFDNFRLVQKGKLSEYDPSVTIARVNKMKK